MTKIGYLEIAGLPKMTNAFKRAHWIHRHKEAQKWKQLVFDECIAKRIHGIHLQKAILTLTRYSSIEPDMDGLTSGFKHVIDGLVLAGVIDDDKPSIITTKYLWQKAKMKEGKISILIEDPLDLDLKEYNPPRRKYGFI